MKKCLFLFFVLISAGAIAQDEVAKFKWDALEFDFGKVVKDVPVSHEFSFVNTGKETLIITDVKASCGCTTPTWPKDPIPPGANGVIKATYNAATMGVFNKAVTVTANVEGGTAVLSIKGEVVDKAQAKTPATLSTKAETSAVKTETAKVVKKAENGKNTGTGKAVKKEVKKPAK